MRCTVRFYMIDLKCLSRITGFGLVCESGARFFSVSIGFHFCSEKFIICRKMRQNGMTILPHWILGFQRCPAETVRPVRSSSCSDLFLGLDIWQRPCIAQNQRHLTTTTINCFQCIISDSFSAPWYVVTIIYNVIVVRVVMAVYICS